MCLRSMPYRTMRPSSSHSFEEHITSHHYTGDQIRFLRAVEDIFLSSRHLSESDLYDSPQLPAFGRNAVDRLFSPVQVKTLSD